jgi:hypothetical protein
MWSAQVDQYHPSVPREILAEVAAGGASDAGGVPVELLDDFLPVLAASVVAGAPDLPSPDPRLPGAG